MCNGIIKQKIVVEGVKSQLGLRLGDLRLRVERVPARPSLNSDQSLLYVDMGEAAPRPGPINSQLSLDLRLRFLETLLSPTASSTSTVSLARRVSHINSLLNQSLESGSGTEAVRRFVANCR